MASSRLIDSPTTRDYAAKMRKALIASIADLIRLDLTTKKKIMKMEPRKASTEPTLKIRGALMNLMEPVPFRNIATQPFIGAAGHKETYELNKEGKMKIKFKNNLRVYLPPGASFDGKKSHLEIWGDKSSDISIGIENIEKMDSEIK